MWKSFPTLTETDIQEARKDRKKARFLVDENMYGAVLKFLKQAGFNAVGISNVGLSGHADEDILAFAKRDDRVVLTHDRDFLDDRRFPLSQNPGIVVLPGAHGNSDALLSAIRHVIRTVGVSRGLWTATRVVVSQDGVWSVYTFEKSSGQIVSNRYRFTPRGMEYWTEES